MATSALLLDPKVVASTSSSLSLLPSPASKVPCYIPEDSLLAEEERARASDLRLAKGFERTSTLLARARVAGKAVW